MCMLPEAIKSHYTTLLSFLYPITQDEDYALHYSNNYVYTFLRGKMTFCNGKHTGAFPGGLVRNPRSGDARSDLRPWRELMDSSMIKILAEPKKSIQTEARDLLAATDHGAEEGVEERRAHQPAAQAGGSWRPSRSSTNASGRSGISKRGRCELS